MKQVFFSKGKATIQNLPVPMLRRGMVLVKTHYSFISSGTEGQTLQLTGKSVASRVSDDFEKQASKVINAIKNHGISGTIQLIRGATERLLEVGYSCSGQVVEACSESGFVKGDFVGCAGAGFAFHGDYVVVPKNLVVKLSGKEHLQSASVVAVASIALQGFRRSGLKFGESVLVIGLGLVGLLTVQFAKNAGCRVIGIDLEDNRLELGKSLGCSHVFNASNPAVEKEIEWLTGRNGVDATIICASSSSGSVINRAMENTRRKGKVVLVGDVKLDFAREKFYEKEIDFLISCSYGPGRYDKKYEQQGCDYPYEFVRWTENRNMQLVVQQIEDGKLNIKDLISKEFAIENAKDAYEFLTTKKPLGITISYNESNEIDELSRIVKMRDKITRPFYSSQKEIGIALVGAGGFAKTALLPILKDIAGVRLRAVVEPNGVGCMNVAKQFGIEYIATDFDEVLADETIDLVVIATPHVLHADQAEKAMAKGKAVFVEKPAAVNFEQLNRLLLALKKYSSVPYCVDFNRSSAPLIIRTKNVLAKRKGPVVLNYRMNAGMLPKGHWINSKANGGRIIGEACHIFELFLSITNSKPISISVLVSRDFNAGMDIAENSSISLSFADGSSAQLVYTAVGSSMLAKERMEVFWDGKSIVMDDFIELKGFGVSPSCNKSLWSADKGHKELLSRFIASVRGERELESSYLERFLEATKISLYADKLARQGGGFMRLDTAFALHSASQNDSTNAA
jgi:predicted dehydrogenase/threonine dehydrogenase-like Zn-dependent dehydrogenase